MSTLKLKGVQEWLIYIGWQIDPFWMPFNTLIIVHPAAATEAALMAAASAIPT